MCITLINPHVFRVTRLIKAKSKERKFIVYYEGNPNKAIQLLDQEETSL